MRIIAGRAKGRRLVAPRGLETRPLTDRAKEALFSSLANTVVGASVLDLYAGSGSIGLEALSRGAAAAVFVEQDRRAVEALRENIARVGLGGLVEAGPVERYLNATERRSGLVFVDPPYALADEDVAGVLHAVAGLAVPGATIVVHRRAGGPEPGHPEDLRLLSRRRYGEVELWRFTKEDE
jgi:16S rRNA (guanine966-N2)-methyltransferase